MPDDLESLRKSFEEAQSALRMAAFEAARANTVNRFKLEEAVKKYLDKENQYLAEMHLRLEKLSRSKQGWPPCDLGP